MRFLILTLTYTNRLTDRTDYYTSDVTGYVDGVNNYVWGGTCSSMQEVGLTFIYLPEKKGSWTKKALEPVTVLGCRTAKHLNQLAYV